MKVGDRVKYKYGDWTGTILEIWDGKYEVPFYLGEQYNPYRVTIQMDEQYLAKTGQRIVYLKMEELMESQ